jgi:hypothetical protein
MKKQEGGKSVRGKRATATTRRKVPAVKRRVARRPLRTTPVRSEVLQKNVRGARAARLAERLVLLALSYLVLLLVFWLVFCGYAFAVWQSIVPRVHAYRLSFAPTVLTEEFPPIATADTPMETPQQVGSTDGLLVIPSVVRDGKISVPVGVPITIVITPPLGTVRVSLYDVSMDGAVPVEAGVTRTDIQDGSLVFVTASSTLKSGQRIGVFGSSEEGWPWRSSNEFIVE